MLMIKPILSQAWGYIPVTPAYKSLRQENHKFEASLRYIIIEG